MILWIFLSILSMTTNAAHTQTIVHVYYNSNHIYSYDKSLPSINFYDDKKHEAYFPLTNFYPYTPFYLDGKIWQTSEHYYQAHKFNDETMQEMFRLLPTPDDARNHALQPDYQLKVQANWHCHSIREEPWDSLKAQIMYKAVKAKFNQHEMLRYMLLQTGYAYLAENDASIYEQRKKLRPSFWGNGKSINDLPGINMMGQILMRVRNKIQNQKKAPEKK